MAQTDDVLKLENQVCFALVVAARNVVSMYRPVLDPLGITHPQYLVMLALWEESPRSLGSLAAALVMEPATLSPIVKRLEALGLVRRTRRTSDERIVDVEPTAAGTALRERALDVPTQVMDMIGLTAEELTTLREWLRPFTSPSGAAASAIEKERPT